jgi:hypothetical protein
VRGLLRTIVALTPLGLTPVLLNLIADGALSVGGGEKDLVWLLPWTLWSVTFAVSSFVLWSRGWPVAGASARAALIGVGVVLVAAAALAALGQLGIGGRF